MYRTRLWKAYISYFSGRIILVTILLCMVLEKEIHSIENWRIKQFTLTHKWNITKTHGTSVVLKILSSKNKTSRLSNAVSIIPLTFLYQNAHNLKHWWIYSISRHISKYEFFFEKSAKNFRLHNTVKTHPGIQDMCPTRRWKA